ncbi:hypothetical protein CTEN210_02210 [Chaetoceros tenuissimus]|uniref:Uncharacterized protein n=1 Tax=Chaetoceros tenuissimus TaxID=426638 RepID=A0AAD3H0G5_9STRA|nr:hypothetical protein CTEN210_02210 [Chaetoceros tenuissimus]
MKEEEREDERKSSSIGGGVARGSARTISKWSRTLSRYKTKRIYASTSIKPGFLRGSAKTVVKGTSKAARKLSRRAVVANLMPNPDIEKKHDSPSSQSKLQYPNQTMHGKKIFHYTNLLIIKNTILGVAVFEIHERSIHSFHRDHTRKDSTSKIDETISQHFAAGVIAGVAHSFLYMTFESTTHMFSSRNQIKMILPKSSEFSSLFSWSIAHTTHHGIAHGFLFSSYEFMKRVLFQNSPRESSVRETKFIDMMKIGFAGGIAGQIQHIASHYTEIWLRVGEDDNVRSY